jgi:hypothetical protein
VISAADCTLGLPGAPVEWHDGSTIIEALRAVLTTAAADRVNINLVYIGFTGGSHGVNAIRLVGCDTANIVVDYYGILTTAVVEFVTTACTNVQVSGYTYVSGVTNGSKDVVDTVGGSTWALTVFDGSAGINISGGSALSPSVSAAGAAGGDRSAISTNVGVLATGATIFTIAGGPIELIGLFSMCTTGGDSTAATLLYTTTPTGLGAVAISAASASIANAPVNATIVWNGTTLATAAVYAAAGTGLVSNGSVATVIIPPGTIKITIGSGPTVTGTWNHYIRYRPLGPSVTVS